MKSVDIAPDSTWLATTGRQDKTVRDPDPATGQQRTHLDHTQPVKSVDIAPDSTWLATTASEDSTVRIADPATGGIGAAMRVDRPLQELTWSPSGETLAATGDAGLYYFTFKSSLYSCGTSDLKPQKVRQANK